MPRDLSSHRSTARAAGWRRVQVALVLLMAGLLTVACGKKGPPLAPIVRTPAPLSDFTVRRSGDTVYLRLTVPDSNSDRTKPADLSRIEVYAYTAAKEVDGIEARDLTLVSEVAVRTPPDPEKDRDTRKQPADVAKPKPEKPVEPGVDQGAIVTITEVLTPEAMKLTPLPRRLTRPAMAVADEPPQGSKLELPAVGPALEGGPRRFYVAYAVNHSGLRGSPSPRFAVAFDPPPPPPGQPRVDVKETSLELSWDPPAGAAVAIGRPTTDPLLPVTSIGMLVPVLPSYNVYVVARTPAPVDAGAVRPPDIMMPLNDKPLTSPSFVDDKIEFGVERCYQVRTVNTVGATAHLATSTVTKTAVPAGTAMLAAPAISESAPSAMACVTPADTVAPPAPTALAAVASAGAISLIWTGVDAPDLAGYLVLRSSTPDGPLTPLFAKPIRETTYRDADVRAGARYIYAVVAVDSAKPPNQGPMSNRAIETAR